MNPPAADHTRYIVACILLIALTCIGCGTWLFIAGYQSGELLIGIAGAGMSSLGTMVAMRRNPGTPATTSAEPATANSTQNTE